MRFPRARLALASAALALLGCAHAPARRAGGDGYALAMTAFACWLEPAATLPATSPASCRAAAVGLWGNEDEVHVTRLRTLDPSAVADLGVMVQALSPPLRAAQRRGLIALIDAMAAAGRGPLTDDFAADLTRLPPPFAEDARSLRLLATTLRSLAEPASERRRAQLGKLAAPLRARLGHVPPALDPLLRRTLQRIDGELARDAASANGSAQ